MSTALDDGGDDTRSKSFNWWRSAEEFDENGHFKVEPTSASELTPKLKLLREMERLARVAPEALDELRYKLASYRAGDLYLPTGGIKKEELEIPPLITILLMGFKSSGKSSLINLMYSVLGRAGLIPFAQTSRDSSKYSTMFLEEHNVLRSMRNGFCVFDSRGLDYDNVDEGLDDVCSWMKDGVRHYQQCWRPSDGDASSGLSWFDSPPRYAKRRVNCAVVVVSVAEIYGALKGGDPKPLEATKELFYCHALRKCYENPILVLTHGDLLSTNERLEGRLKICEFLGISESSGACDIVCLTESGFLADEYDPVVAYTLTEAIYRALLFSDRTHNPKKSFNDWFLLCSSWLMCYIAAFFAFLAYCFSRLADKTGNKLKR
ncbi:hypothetical protein MRB53_027982 [Persea americana]|uniref:Uncharacterized protein n=1 Tax=Persea americana TaxID=3435 RepID=A0ACC2KEW3_PERAE|nr:hypothetical protein MRB53_027982 [Persea americana]